MRCCKNYCNGTCLRWRSDPVPEQAAPRAIFFTMSEAASAAWRLTLHQIRSLPETNAGPREEQC